jgi:hypothetical protein
MLPDMQQFSFWEKDLTGFRQYRNFDESLLLQSCFNHKLLVTNPSGLLILRIDA